MHTFCSVTIGQNSSTVISLSVPDQCAYYRTAFLTISGHLVWMVVHFRQLPSQWVLKYF